MSVGIILYESGLIISPVSITGNRGLKDKKK